jgi:hypothetical protein
MLMYLLGGLAVVVLLVGKLIHSAEVDDKARKAVGRRNSSND